ncbi:4Fe-4S protein [Desulfitobacterium dichloroeliminans LMG P-21439]|uniref:4Fe-4S protein n=1 Tax=Desulfitobacterium dichloroeliminans (strain LMG P-21439 / DCA1) TaxID=871963 RepID=L0F333_DESDL|nr:4Fe-4S dicluster domain-containing protein [Desulfitobacterium dichloroeliminans]AGA68259.1 4Fe-4S protein [Desulfitobacterium dichloroeliminans LMG P-21439]
MSDQRNKVLKQFSQEYKRTDDGFHKKVHGYFYLRYNKLYVYLMKMGLNKMLPKPHKLVMPPGEHNKEAMEAVSMFASHTGRKSMSIETSDYHAKVLRVEDAAKFFKLEQDLNLPDLPKTIIPFEVARKTIIKNPESLCVIDCPCREARGEEGCYPRDVCLVLGEPWVSFALEYGEESNARRITQEEALRIVHLQHEAGNVHSIFWKSSQNDRTYAMCNCCACCCTALQGHNYVHSPMMASSGYKCEVDIKQCISCGACTEHCNFFALEIKDGTLSYQPEKCYGCGVCESICPNGAITMRRDDPLISEPLDLDVLIPKYTPKE